ncbi:MAG: hypothetical protein OWS74_08120 [Firmicutes bacterium]|nr:hypothetical protein [Bacillota bacterium]
MKKPCGYSCASLYIKIYLGEFLFFIAVGFVLFHLHFRIITDIVLTIFTVVGTPLALTPLIQKKKHKISTLAGLKKTIIVQHAIDQRLAVSLPVDAFFLPTHLPLLQEAIAIASKDPRLQSLHTDLLTIARLLDLNRTMRCRAHKAFLSFLPLYSLLEEALQNATAAIDSYLQQESLPFSQKIAIWLKKRR